MKNRGGGGGGGGTEEHGKDEKKVTPPGINSLGHQISHLYGILKKRLC